MAKLDKSKMQKLAYDQLVKIIKDETVSASVKTQALTQLIRLSDLLPVEPEADELSEFLKQ